MKSIKFLVVVLLALAVTSCQKDEDNNVSITQKQDVTFGIVEQQPNTGLKNDPWEFDCLTDADGMLLIPTIAEIEVVDASNNTQTFTPQVFYLDDKLYTQAIKLEPGTYTITKFLLLTGIDGDIVMAIPETGSTFAPYVTKSVNFTFEVEAFKKVELDVEVLCFSERVYDDFGFSWFYITEIVIREFCFFGDICANDNPWLPSDFDIVGSPYLDVPGGIQMDMPAIFMVYAFKDGEALPNSPFSNLGFEDQPLCVQYPDRIRTDGEVFTFDLYILVPDGLGDFEYVFYHTFTATDAGALDVTDIDGDGVIDFVLGDCNYSATDLQLPIAP